MFKWYDLVEKTDAELAQLDIADVNHACAAGLPGAEHLDVKLCNEALHHVTNRVAGYTDRVFHQFSRDPSRYRNSEAYFRMLTLITVVQRDCGYVYNPGKIDPNVPLDAPDSFVFGLFQGDGGTCGSLPVLFTSIARRLGYPLKIVTTWNHLFCRWEEPNGERLNIEASDRGMNAYPDEYYRENECYAKVMGNETECGAMLSLTPRQELGGFLR